MGPASSSVPGTIQVNNEHRVRRRQYNTPRFYGAGVSSNAVVDITWTLPALTHMSTINFPLQHSVDARRRRFSPRRNGISISMACLKRRAIRRAGAGQFHAWRHAASPGFHSTIALVEQALIPAGIIERWLFLVCA